MKFVPLGKNIAIEFIEKEGVDQQAIILPTDYRPAEAPYEVVRVAESEGGHGCMTEWNTGELLVVEAHMIRQFEFQDTTYHIIAENHVVGWFPQEDE